VAAACEGRVGIVVEHHAVLAPHQHERHGRAQQESQDRPQARRPVLDGAERRRRPVARADEVAQLAAAREEGRRRTRPMARPRPSCGVALRPLRRAGTRDRAGSSVRASWRALGGHGARLACPAEVSRAAYPRARPTRLRPLAMTQPTFVSAAGGGGDQWRLRDQPPMRSSRARRAFVRRSPDKGRQATASLAVPHRIVPPAARLEGSLRGCLRPDRHATACGFPRLGVGFRELGPEEQDQGRVVDPQQDGDERRGSAVAGGDAASADIVADQELAERERQARDQSSGPDISPSEPDGGRTLKIIANSRKRSQG
jgi:hypothetical protein